MDNLKNKTLKGVAWKLTQSFATKGLGFFFAIFMTRMLTPKDYGLVGMLTVFIMIAQAFIDCGFGQALIRKKKLTDADTSTAFFFNFITSCTCYLLLFFGAPFVAIFYNMPVLKELLRVEGLALIIGALYSIQTIIFTKNLNFKTPTLVGLFSNFISGIGGVSMAYMGLGVWAIVGQQIIFNFTQAVTFYVVSSWRPKFLFSRTSLREMFSFGSKLLGARLLDVAYNQVSPIFIGKYYSASQLGLFSKSEQLASFPCNTIYSALSNVTYPVLSKMQDDKERLSRSYRKFICITAFVLFPFMVLLATLSKPLLISLFGEKWAGASIYLSIMCFPWMLVPIHNLNINVLTVKGRTDLVLKLGVIVKAVGFLLLCITLPISVTAVCVGYAITTYSCYFVNTYYTARYIDYTLKMQIIDIIKPLILSFVVAGLTYLVTYPITNVYIKFFSGFTFGILLYVFVSKILKLSEYYEVKGIVVEKIVNKFCMNRYEV